MKLNLNSDNVFQMSMTVEETDEILSGHDAANFEDQLLIAKSMVSEGDAKESYLVIKIKGARLK